MTRYRFEAPGRAERGPGIPLSDRKGKIMEIHCSTLPRVMRCPASAYPPAVRIERGSVAAQIGVAVHEALATYVGTRAHTINEVCETHSVPTDAAASLYWSGVHMYDEFAEGLRVLAVESSFGIPLSSEHTLCGTADLIAEELDAEVPTIIVWDWKTGRVQRDYLDQFRGYALHALHFWPEAENFKLVTAWCRDAVVESAEILAEDIMSWRGKLIAQLAKGEVFAASPEACEFCPRAHECPALRAEAQAGASALIPLTDAGALMPAEIARLKPKRDMLQKVLRQYDDALKAACAAHGPLAIGNGREVYLSESTRQAILFDEARSTLREHFDVATDDALVEHIAGALSLSKGELLRIVAREAPRGSKGTAKDALMEQLKSAGAVQETTYTQIATREVNNGDN